MRTPFTTEQFLDVFRQYNEAVWPWQGILHLLAIAAIVLGMRGTARDGRAVSSILAALWLWAGAVYHLTFFSVLNPAAVLFGFLFIAQAVLFVVIGVARGRLTFRPRSGASGLLGAALVLYALVGYPVLGYALGHTYPAAPTFGVPCPTVIFTFGLLLWATPVLPRLLLVAPVLWAMVATSAALQLGMREDLGLTVAAVIAVAFAWPRAARRAQPSEVATSASPRAYTSPLRRVATSRRRAERRVP